MENSQRPKGNQLLKPEAQKAPESSEALGKNLPTTDPIQNLNPSTRHQVDIEK